MDYSVQNAIDRDFLKNDFSVVNELVSRIRKSLIDGNSVHCKDLNLDGILDFDNSKTYIYITLFQAGLKPVRWGSCRKTLEETVNRDIIKIRENMNFKDFALDDNKQCRIMIEYVTGETPVKLEDIEYQSFSLSRFEPGITGLKIVLQNNTYLYMPSDAWVNSQMDLKSALNSILRKTYIKNQTNKISERISILQKTPHQCYLIKSRIFITYNDEILPLYRGNVLYEYSVKEIKQQALAGADFEISKR